jgi:REP-associated tyrosine transposase
MCFRCPSPFSDVGHLLVSRPVSHTFFPCGTPKDSSVPNHFHFLIHADERTEKKLPGVTITRKALSEGVRLLLSSYSKGINEQENRTGNLIQQKTKSKCVFDTSNWQQGYTATCFHYIHQNPLRAGLVHEIEDWHFSSYRDYAGLRQGTLCNQHLAKDLLGIDLAGVGASRTLADDALKNIW